MRLSINPLYRCNFRCPYCYLTPEQLRSKQLLHPIQLRVLLQQLPEVTAVELYGGEVTLLDPTYVEELKTEIRRFYSGPIAVTTNLSQVPDWLLEDDIDINVSFDFQYRPKYREVWENILTLPKSVNIIVLATPEVMEGNVMQQIALLNQLHNVRYVEIKPYSSNQANAVLNAHDNYVQYVKQWVEYFDNRKLINVMNLDDVVTRRRNAYSRDHLYITPQGRFAVLDFDQNDREYFREIKNFREFLEWTSEEFQAVQAMKCKSCEYKGRCLTEHYRRTEGEIGECSGFKSLIDWYVERTTGVLPSARPET